MKTLMVVLATGVAGMLLLLAGCSETAHHPAPDASAANTVNSTCPIMNMKVDQDRVPTALVLDFEGRKIGFCCSECIGKWKALSDADKETKLMAVLNGSSPSDTG